MLDNLKRKIIRALIPKVWRDYSYQVLKSLVACLIYSERPLEVDFFVNRLSVCTETLYNLLSGKPSEIIKHVIKYDNSKLDSIIKEVEKEHYYNKPTKDIDDYELIQSITVYQDWLSLRIRYGEVTCSTDVIHILSALTMYIRPYAGHTL